MEDIIKQTVQFVKEIHIEDVSGHDWYHIERVWKNAIEIAKDYPDTNLLVIQLAALLHDVADTKLNDNLVEAKDKLKNYVQSLEILNSDKEAVLQAISTVSYNGGNNQPPTTMEGKIVQDADRLDAIGAIGIARTFAYGGKKGQAIYDPMIPIRETITKTEYRQGISTSINHFYEKLLLLKDLLHTDKAKELAQSRQEIMEQFLKQFFYEWNGK